MNSVLTNTNQSTKVTLAQETSTNSTWVVPAKHAAQAHWTPPPGVIIQGYNNESTAVHPPHTLSPMDGTLVIETTPSTSSGTVTLVGTDHSTLLPFVLTSTHTG